jgi:hypothetical protein
MAVLVHDCDDDGGGEGQEGGGMIPTVEEERGPDSGGGGHGGREVEADADAEGAWYRRTRWRSGLRQVCDGEIAWLGFRGSGTLKKKNSSYGRD